MVRTERQPVAGDRIDKTHTERKRRSLDPERIAEHLGGNIERLKDIPIRSVDTLDVVEVVERWKISVPNTYIKTVTDIYIMPKSEEVSVIRQKEGDLSSDFISGIRFPISDLSNPVAIPIGKVTKVEYLEGRVKFTKTRRNRLSFSVTIKKTGEVESEGDGSLLAGTSEIDMKHFIDPKDLE